MTGIVRLSVGIYSCIAASKTSEDAVGLDDADTSLVAGIMAARLGELAGWV